MSAPLSLSRVLGALQAAAPPRVRAWAESGFELFAELGVIAYVFARIADIFEAIPDEHMPDTTAVEMSRWLSIFLIDTKPNDTTNTQRSRLLTRIRRQVGYTLPRLAQVLALPLELDPDDVQFVEILRRQIDDATTWTDPVSGLVLPPTATPLVRPIGAPWPGVVDDTGVKITLTFTSWTGSQQIAFQLRHASGAAFAGGLNGTGGPPASWETRTTFLGLPAAGPWTFSVWDVNGSNNVTFNQLKIRVSNDVDAAQVYYFYAYRNPSLSGTPDIGDAQQLFTRTALAHALSVVCQRLTLVFDDALSLIEREPIGV